MKRSTEYQSLRQYVLSGQYQAAMVGLSKSTALSTSEREELQSLIEFQIGKLTPPETRRFDRLVHFLACLAPGLFLFVLRACRRILLGTPGVAQKLNAKFEAVYLDRHRYLIHARYSNFTYGLSQSLSLSAICSTQSFPVESAYLKGLIGHFYCLSGRFDAGLPLLEHSVQKLEALQVPSEGQIAYPLQLLLEIRAILALQVIYSGRPKAGQKMYEDLIPHIESAGYFWLRAFARTMRLYASLELLDEAALGQDIQELQFQLGDTFRTKYGLRTTAYAGLISALKGRLHVARHQSLRAESYYDKTDSFVERGRYHYVRALIELELGQQESAIYHGRRATDFFVPISGGAFFEAESVLLTTEIELRTMVAAPRSRSFDGRIQQIHKRLRGVRRLIRGAPAFERRVDFLLLLSRYLTDDQQAALDELDQFLPQLNETSPRLKELGQRFTRGSSSVQGLNRQSELLIEQSLLAAIAEISAIPKAHDPTTKGLNLLAGILGVDSIEISDKASAATNDPDVSVTQDVGRLTARLKFSSRTVEAVFLGSPNIEFDRDLRLLVEVLLQMIHSIALAKEAADHRQQAEIGRMAAQVAHDIRSPLSALNMVVASFNNEDAEKRRIIRSATQRINDIANSLIEKNRGKTPSEHETQPVLMLGPVVGSIISEKRTQYRNQSHVNIVEDISDAYGIFVSMSRVELARALSNLIDNAVDALKPEGGTVTLKVVENSQGSAEVHLTDDGKGMPPEVLMRLGERGFTVGKGKLGSGIGFHHAKSTIEGAKGAILVHSEVGRGTTIKILLPQEAKPDWFLRELQLEPGQLLLTVDDDETIHQLWANRFAGTLGRTSSSHLAFRSIESFEQWLVSHPSANFMALVDHEFIGSRERGLDAIVRLKLAGRAVLVTSHYDEVDIVDLASKHGIKILPKGQSNLVPIVGGESMPSVDAVLVDDDSLVRATWQMAAKDSGRHLVTFASEDEFLANQKRIPLATPLYIDVELGNGIRGEHVASRASRVGYRKIFLATGYDAGSITRPACVSGVRGKEPPFAGGGAG